MKFSEQWLREWVNPTLNTKLLCERLTLAGLEVESISDIAGCFTLVKVAEIIHVEPHPNAARLKICQVNDGSNLPLTIVCGATNARVGLRVALAGIGAILPNQIKIKKVKLRGVSSQGMLCSSQELGLSNDPDVTGLLELPRDAPIGEALRTYLQLEDKCIDIHVTPNRGDCLSIKGLAREVSALTKQPFHLPEIPSIKPEITDTLAVQVASTIDCPRYVGRIIRGINTNAQTPNWMVERLRRAGFRAIHPVVDVTNFVMLELGQPLHAFDLACLGETIIVRHADRDEELCLLDGKEIRLNEKTLVIADQLKVHAIAGVMGGKYSAVSCTTTDVFLESAFFVPTVLAGCARWYGINSEAAYRFERGVDPTLAPLALERATALLLEIVEGKPGPIVDINNYKNYSNSITLRQSRIHKVLGFSLTTFAIEGILYDLGFQFTRLQTEESAWSVMAPSWRFDISLEVDLIEELARVYGYADIPAARPRSDLHFLSYPEHKLPLSRLRQLLVDREYQEVITYSFTSERLQQITALMSDVKPVALLNPLSHELSVMRTSLWPGLLNVVSFNQKRQQSRVRLFETGLCFQQQADKLQQIPYFAALASGNVVSEQWGTKQVKLDFFTVKSDIEAIFRLTGQLEALQFLPTDHPALCPGQSSMILHNGNKVGYFGALRSDLLEKLDLLGPLYLYELLLELITKVRTVCFKPFSKYPKVRRDISFWIKKQFLADDIVKCVKQAAGNDLIACYFFDSYQGKGLTEVTHSLALALFWQHPARTLCDAEIEASLAKVLVALKHTFLIQLRE